MQTKKNQNLYPFVTSIYDMVYFFKIDLNSFSNYSLDYLKSIFTKIQYILNNVQLIHINLNSIQEVLKTQNSNIELIDSKLEKILREMEEGKINSSIENKE